METFEAVITVDKSAELEHLEQQIIDADRIKYYALCVIQERELWKPQYKTWDYYLGVKRDISSLAWKRMKDSYKVEVK